MGPELSGNTTFNFLKEFADSLETQLNCKVVIKGSPNFEAFFESILFRKSHIFIIGDYLGEAVEQEGYQAILKREKPTKIILATTIQDLAKVRSNKQRINIYVASPYSIVNVAAQDWAKQQSLQPIADYIYGHTYSSAIMDLLRKPNTVVFAPQDFILNLPPNLKSQLTSHDLNLQVSAYFIVDQFASPALKTAIIKGAPLLNRRSQWLPTDTIIKSKYSKAFTQQIQSLKQNLQNR